MKLGNQYIVGGPVSPAQKLGDQSSPTQKLGDQSPPVSMVVALMHGAQA